MKASLHDVIAYAPEYRKAKLEIGSVSRPSKGWYPYDSIGNFFHIGELLQGTDTDLPSLINNEPVADIGAADGDTAFILAHFGCEVDIIDHAVTNFNGLEGAQILQKNMQLSTSIHDIDLDSQFQMPRDRYGLILMLGLLYHLQNPFYVLRELAHRSSNLLLSTKITRLDGSAGRDISQRPLAYLLDERECNNDPSNYWIFTEEGLKRLATRTGWIVERFITLGDTRRSEPASMEHDERAFVWLRSASTVSRT